MTLEIKGQGLYLKEPQQNLYCGNSATAARLLAGVLVGQKFESTISGDKSLSLRPMRRIIEPLQAMGANITALQGHLPIKIKPASLEAINYQLPVASAQVKSCLLLANLYSKTPGEIFANFNMRNHTELMLAQFSQQVGQDLEIIIPSDISAAAFFIVLATCAPNSKIKCPQVGLNPTRAGILTILAQAGANFKILNKSVVNNELRGDLYLFSSKLKGFIVQDNIVPSLIDEIPILMIAALRASSPSDFYGLQELRFKECDRLQVMLDAFMVIGANYDILGPHSLRIYPLDYIKVDNPKLNAHSDHRMVMSFVILSNIYNKILTIINCENVDTSFVDFYANLAKISIK